MRAALLFFVAVLTASSAAAQASRQVISVESMKALLASADPVDQAWGAWMAGRLVAVDAAPELERVVREGLAEGPRSYPARVAIGLDALIEIDARPSPQLLGETAGGWPVQSLLLLSRLDQSANPVLLGIMSRAHGYEWFAAANMLHRRKAPGFAAHVLTGMTFVAELVVSNEGGTMQGMGGGSFTIGDMAGGVMPGNPPSTIYQFRGCLGGRLGLLASGPTSVCYEKARSEAGLTPALSSHDIGGPSADDRLKYFVTEANFEMTQALQEPIRWTSDDDLKRSMAELVGRVRARHATLIRRLIQRGWLSEEEGQQLADPVIRERVIDLRKQ
jgi:hypothetical protein